MIEYNPGHAPTEASAIGCSAIRQRSRAGRNVVAGPRRARLVPAQLRAQRPVPRTQEAEGPAHAYCGAVDVAEFEVDDGKATWIYLDDCRVLAQTFEDALVAALGAKGYAAKALPILSIGQGADSTATCRVFSAWDKRDLRPKDPSPSAPPFYVDSTLNATAERRSSWRDVLQATGRLKAPRSGTSLTIPVPTTVHEAMGADYVLVVVGLGTRNVVYRGVGTGGRFGGMTSVADPSPYPGSSLQVALIDCRDGLVLWADNTSDFRAFSVKRMHDLAQKIVGA